MFTKDEKNNIFLKLSIDQNILDEKIKEDKLIIFNNPKDALYKAYNININNIKGDKNSKQLILNLLKLDKEQCIGLDGELTLADAFIAFHHKTCRASDNKFVVILD